MDNDVDMCVGEFDVAYLVSGTSMTRPYISISCLRDKLRRPNVTGKMLYISFVSECGRFEPLSISLSLDDEKAYQKYRREQGRTVFIVSCVEGTYSEVGDPFEHLNVKVLELEEAVSKISTSDINDMQRDVDDVLATLATFKQVLNGY